MNGLFVHRIGIVHRIGDRLSPAELSAARLDGHVVELGEAYVPADLVETAALRALSLATVLPRSEGVAFAGMSAAWIHGAGDAPPRVHEIQSASGRRLRSAPVTRLIVHDVALGHHDVRRIGTVAVASPERTLIDLLRWPPTVPERAVWARALAEADPTLVTRILTRAEVDGRGPGMDRVRAFLRARGAPATPAATPVRRGQEDVTR
ncbi:type IV toxin-antitoxin system AbiEi family antitoxin [uncultured Microbacterium sp.]|uniref:type IV toxin-antitoxin system AbiEi family antitoxin n=1 Tax=uncultured Microbacterium sp. TaxID=191216 RepID=UPI0025F6C789|nr:type IV toxin-antitoxin system AbiEi family antitoxin [uncultured Microbacterium sp.]